jgi:OFA family oxalate/formate antiporter-like MFS transporter
MQAVLIILLAMTREGTFLSSIAVMVALSALIGANYGANLSLFPSITKDFYGLKNFGMNYGLVFTAWGVGGFVLAKVMGEVYDYTKSFSYAYFAASILLAVAAVTTFLVRPPHHAEQQAAG